LSCRVNSTDLYAKGKVIGARPVRGRFGKHADTNRKRKRKSASKLHRKNVSN